MMKQFALLIAAAIAAAAAPTDARPHRRDQSVAFEATQQGKLMPLREFESRVIPRMRGADYLGPELDSGRYRLKFRRGDRVIWVDVDGRTGRVVGKTGE